MAYTQGDRKEIRRATKQVLSNVVQGDVNILNLPMADMELLFLKVRSKSIGEIAEITFENTEKKVRKVPVNLSEVEVYLPEGRNYKIDIVDPEGKPTSRFFMMKEPTVAIIDEVINLKLADPNVSEDIEIAARCVDKVCDETSQKSGADMLKEIKAFIEDMTPIQFKDIEEFLDGTPVIRHEIDLGKVFPDLEGSKYTLEGLEAFFE